MTEISQIHDDVQGAALDKLAERYGTTRLGVLKNESYAALQQAYYTAAIVRIAELETSNTALKSQRDALLVCVRKAVQLAHIASDWNISDVEIDGEIVGTYNLADEFTAAIAASKDN